MAEKEALLLHQVGSRDRGLVAEGVTQIAMTYCAKSNLEPHMEAYRTIDSITDSTEPR